MTREEIETYQRESNQRAGYDPEKHGVAVAAWCIHRQQYGLNPGNASAGTDDCHPCLNHNPIITE